MIIDAAAVAVNELPPDPFWPIRVVVPHDGDLVPYQLMLAYHWQFSTKQLKQLPA